MSEHFVRVACMSLIGEEYTDIDTVLCDSFEMAHAYVRDLHRNRPINLIEAWVSGVTPSDLHPGFDDYVRIDKYAPKFYERYLWDVLIPREIERLYTEQYETHPFVD